MKRIALIKNSFVENIALWDGESPWEPEGYNLVDVTDSPEVAIGDGWEELTGFTPKDIPDPVIPEPTLAETLETIFITAIQEHGDLILPSEEGDLFALKVSIAEMLKFNRLAAAKAKIEAATIPEALEPVRAAMLEVFPP